MLNESLINKANKFSFNYYNANTSHYELDNRISAIKSVIDTIGFENINTFVVKPIRYYGGYYATYLFSKVSSIDMNIIEYGIGNSTNYPVIRLYKYGTLSGAVTQIREI